MNQSFINRIIDNVKCCSDDWVPSRKLYLNQSNEWKVPSETHWNCGTVKQEETKKKPTNTIFEWSTASREVSLFTIYMQWSSRGKSELLRWCSNTTIYKRSRENKSYNTVLYKYKATGLMLLIKVSFDCTMRRISKKLRSYLI